MADTTPSSVSSSVTAGRTIGLILAPTSVRIAQTLGLTLTAFVSGQTLSTTLSTIPALLHSPASLLLSQWMIISRDVKKASTIALAVSAPALAWLASQEPTWNSRAFTCYLGGTLITAICLPYSLLGMAGIEAELSRRHTHEDELHLAEAGGKSTDLEVQSIPGGLSAFVSRNVNGSIRRYGSMSVHQLVDRWAWWNFGRGVLMGIGAVAATWGVVCNDLSVFE